MQRAILLLLVLCLLFSLLSGCNNAGSQESASPTVTDNPSMRVGDDELKTADVTEGTTGGLTLPFAEPVEISWWGSMSSTYYDDDNERLVFKELENRTNAHVTFIIVTTQTKTENFNIMMMSGEYCDIIESGNSLYSGGVELAISEGIYLRINDIIESYMPNLSAALSEHPAVLRDITTDEGNIGTIPNIIVNRYGREQGLVTRQDLLDELEMDKPVTYDDWYELLTIYKTAYGMTTPLTLYYSGIGQDNTLIGGYGALGFTSTGSASLTPFYQVDGIVHYSPIEDGFFEYLTMMNQWYSEGLLNSDFLNISDRNVTMSTIYEGNSGIWFMSAAEFTAYVQTSAIEGFKITPITDPTKSEGDVTHFLNDMSIGNSGNVVFSVNAVDRVEKIAVWVDYWYSEEGSLLCNYGLAGESFEYDAGGTPQYSELVTNNPDGINFSNAMNVYAMQNGPFINDQSKWLVSFDTEVSASAPGLWVSNRDGEYVYPGTATMTAGEADEYGSLYNDIKTYLDENILKFITGERSLTEWSSYVDEIYKMNIEYCIELKQAALHRYSER